MSKESNAIHSRWAKRIPDLSRLSPDNPARRNYEAGKQCGSCKFFAKLKGDLGMDWGVCTNAKATWDGDAVFEHFSCSRYEQSKKGWT